MLNKNLILKVMNFQTWNNSAQNGLHVLGKALDHLEELDSANPGAPLQMQVTEVIFKQLERQIFATSDYRYGNLEERFMALKTAALEIAIMNDIGSSDTGHKPAYHNRMHFLNVQLCGRMIDQLNLQQYKSKLIEPIDLAVNAVTDLAHDAGHAGRGNIRNGVYYAMEIETESLRYINKKALFRYNVDFRDLSNIQRAILSSDAMVPKDMMRQAFKTHFRWAPNFFKLPDDHLNIDPRSKTLAIDRFHYLLDHPKTTFMAARLADADLFASFGMGQKKNARECFKLHQEITAQGGPALCDENGQPYPEGTLKAMIGFVGGVLSKSDHAFVASFATPGAQWLGNAALRKFQKSTQDALEPEKIQKIIRLMTGVPVVAPA